MDPVSRWFERRDPTAAHAEQPRDPLQRQWYWASNRLGESATAGNQLNALREIAGRFFDCYYTPCGKAQHEEMVKEQIKAKIQVHGQALTIACNFSS